jgi:hypothetical protein
MRDQPQKAIALNAHLSGAEAYDALRGLLRRCDVEDTLRLIASVAAEQAAGRGDGASFPGYQLALVVRALLENERNGRTASLTLGDLALCCELASATVTSPETAFGVPVSDNAWSLIHRAAYQQLPDQEEGGYAPRSLAIYRQLAPIIQDSVGFRFEDAFRSKYGLTVDESWRIGYGLYRQCLVKPGDTLHARGLTQEIGMSKVGEARVGSFLRNMACDYAAFRALLDVPSGQNAHFEPYNLNPFRKHPVLKLPDDSYLVPIPSFLLRRLTHGLYYDLVELDRSGFVKLIGEAFRAYVGRLLDSLGAEAAPPADGQPWAVYDADTVVFVECLTRPFGALSRATGDYAHVRGDLARRGGLVDSVKRLQERRQKAHGKRSIGLVVALEDFYLANGPFIRSIVNEELESQGRHRMDDEIQLAHVSGLETLSALAACSGSSLPALLANKVDSKEFTGMELETYARYMATILLPGQDTDLTPNLLKEAASTYLNNRVIERGVSPPS